MLQEKAQDRERLLLKFIKIMKVTEPRPEPAPQPCPAPALTARLSRQHLRKLNNFNSYLAILSALDSAPIRRLEWQKQTSEVSSGQEWRPGLGPCSASALLCGGDSPPCLPRSLACSPWALRGVAGAGVSHHSALQPAPQAVPWSQGTCSFLPAACAARRPALGGLH